jgi:ketosteroid isomerase-like protein
VLDAGRARELIDRWIAAWNRRDLDAVMDMVADDVVFESPFLVQMYDEPGGKLRGRRALRGWFERALSNPDFHIDPPLHVFTGVDSIVLVERVNGTLAANVFTLDPSGRIARSAVHG